MAAYVARRVLSLVPVWVGISVLAFALSVLAPGDPVRQALQQSGIDAPSPEQVAEMRRELGLDAPPPVRYARWVGDALTGDLGRSIRTGEPVLGALAERFPRTATLALVAVVLGLAIALPLGVVSAVLRNSALDHVARLGALVGASIPSFWLAYLLIIAFAVQLKVLPVAGSTTPQHLVLPALTLAIGAAASLTRLTRSAMLEELSQEYVRTGRAKGLRERAVVVRHALRNALIAIATVTGIRLAALLGGAVIVETIFAWPGIGKFVVDSIGARDYPVIQGFVLFAGTVVLAINLAVDLAYVWLDPRVRLGGRARGN
ncbi:MAG TPA: nickel ABC transporter permease [Candidatus Limnocylindria bacterium]|nr:nickel ABC transporter permease [Candidatus Limnocylindria bacterium]